MLPWLFFSACTFVTDEEWAGRLIQCELEGQFVDEDGDGWGVEPATDCDQLAISVNRSGDCDDSASGSYPGATEVLYDGVDADCLGDSDWDKDGDGFDAVVGGGTDCFDDEADGLPAFEGDCDVARGTFEPADIYPGAVDVPYDGVDADCSGGTDFDADADGFPSCDECDDTDPERFPNSEVEIWYNGYDEDCNGNDGDQDGDGYVVANYTFEPAPGQLYGDCWDDPAFASEEYVSGNGFPEVTAAEVHPGAADTWYDWVDADCANNDDLDQDADGDRTDLYPNSEGAFGGDCNDLDPDISSRESESWYDGVDSDCSGGSDFDRDGDGDESEDWGGGDCDEGDPTVSQYAAEDCASAGDDDCDGAVNEENAVGCSTLYPDNDGDGYGSAGGLCLCLAQDGYTSPFGTDCDDGNPAASPAGTEDCATPADDDCDADPVELDASGCSVFYEDNDGDGLGGPNSVCACDAGAVYSAAYPSDCDDSTSAITADYTWYADEDGDGWGNESSPVLSCTQLSGLVASVGDCDDTSSIINPDAAETCASSADENCDGTADEAEAVGCTSYWADLDADGYTGSEACLCAPSGSYSELSDEGDCDEESSAASPGSSEVCMDGRDGACDASPGACAVSGDAYLSAFPFQFSGASGDSLGGVLAAGGDLDGDALGEFLLGVPDSAAGSVYLLGNAASSGEIVEWASALVQGESTGDRFGAALVGLGDVDADGYGDFAVGAPAALGSGEAYLYFGPLLADSTAGAADSRLYGSAGEAVGSSLAALGDPDANGVAGMAVGVPENDSYGTSSGMVWIYQNASVWGSASAGGVADAALYGDLPGQFVGTSLAGGADVSGDGIADLAVGAPGYDAGSGDEGAIYVVHGPFSGSSLLFSSDLTVSGVVGDRGLGGGALALGDVTGDGAADVIGSAPGDAAVASNAGAVWVFSGSLTGTQAVGAATVALLGNNVDEEFGTSLAVGDTDGDGRMDLLVGAPGADSGTGSVDVFLGYIVGTMYSSSASARFLGASVGDGAGTGTAWLDDVDGDGWGDFLIGSPAANGGDGLAYRVRAGGY